MLAGRERRILGAMQNEIELTVNGDVRRLPVGATVESLIGSLGLDRRKLAVERNREIVPRSAYAVTGLCDQDQIEIVHFIGGG